MTDASGIAHRRALADAVRRQRDQVADHVTEEFLRRHPQWVTRYGDLAWTRGVEDARFHLDFLAGAIESGDPRTFAEYARWCAGMLDARGIPPEFLIENLTQAGDHLGTLLSDADALHIERFVETGRAAAGLPADQAAGAPGALHASRNVYLQAILNGERRAALTVVQELLREGHAVTDIYCDVLQPAQHELGRLWERNEITVAREHMGTAITQFVIAQLYSRIEVPATIRGRAVVTGVQGELHQLGGNMVADVLEADGWSVRFLGTQTPQRDVLHAIEQHEPTVLAVSATMLFNLRNASDLIDQARARFGSDMKIIVGGSAFRFTPGLWQDMGADAYGLDLRDAVARVRALTGGAG
jgi:MerR family transcriptional regulator, light-induced transcriptional regulator